MGKTLDRYKVEEQEQWREWVDKIPFISWPADWQVKAVPPFAGALLRYVIKTPRCERISVYLDCFDRLGYFGEPYWEVYPHKGDCFRCPLNDTEELLKAIGECP